MNEKNWLLVGAIVIVSLIALSALTLYYFPPNSIPTTSYTPQSEVFYFSVSNGYSNSTSPLIQYSNQTQGIIENATLTMSCASCYYEGWYNTTSIFQGQSGAFSQINSQSVNGTGMTSIVVQRGQATKWTVMWNITMVTYPLMTGTFDFTFTCPNSTIPIDSLGPVNAVGTSPPAGQAYSIGTFSDINGA